MKHTWIAELYRHKHTGADPLFIPEYFFKLPEEVQYYKQHIENYKRDLLAWYSYGKPVI